MANQLPSGRWRGRVSDGTGRQVAPHTIIGGPKTYPTRREAERAEDQARDQLLGRAARGVTVTEWQQHWTTDPLWQRPSESTNRHNAERTRRFAQTYGHIPIRAVDDTIVTEWLRGGRNRSTVPALRAMFNDATSGAAGRLIDRNPFANLRLPGSRGRRHRQPPHQAQAAELIAHADQLTPPSFAAYLHTAIFEGMRPGELDALAWAALDFQARTIRVERQWCAKVRKFTPPKHGVIRTIAMTEPVRERLLELPRESEFVFTTLRGTHYTPSSRNHHWNRTRCAAGLADAELYLCTRHHFAWYAWNVLGLAPEDIAQHLGHQDGGDLVRRLYGHFDQAKARERVRQAFAQAPAAPVPLIRKDAA